MADQGNSSEESDGAPNEDERTPFGWQQFWNEEVVSAEKRLRTFRRQGNATISAYLDDDKRISGFGDEMPQPSNNRAVARLNLFKTNTTTLFDMLSGSTPKITVSRQFSDPDDDVARIGSTLYQRMLECDIEPSGETLSAVLKASLMDRLLPGMGLARVRYEFESEMTSMSAINPQDGTAMQVEEEKITFESAPVEYVHWQDFLWGWARRWEEVPWIAFRSWLTKDEATKRFGDKKARELTYSEQTPTGVKEDPTNLEDRNNVRKAGVWEIWFKKEAKVFWFSTGSPVILDSEDDPLGLENFWPMPRPMLANTSTSLMVPKADYTFAADIYQEIDVLYTRIAAITRAVKVTGVFDQSAGSSVGRMLQEADENQLIPVDNWAMFAEKGGLKGVIDFFPVADISATLAQIRQVLGEQIELLYQVTGMSDVMRGGNTDQYTSDGTNQLKAKFGSVQVQALQDEYARFASELESIKAEIIAKHFQPQSIFQQSNAQFIATPDRPMIMPAIELMKNPMSKWRINIKPESMNMMDMAALKNERIEFMTATGTYLQSAVSMGKEFPESAPLLLELLKFGLSGFRESESMEGIVDAMVQDLNKKAQEAAQNPQEDPAQAEMQAKMALEQAKMQLQQMKGQQEMQKIQMKSQSDMQTLKMKIDGELAKIQADSQADQSLEAISARNELIKIREDLNAAMREIAASLSADLKVEEAQSTFAIAEKEVEHRNAMVEMATEGEIDASLLAMRDVEESEE